MPVITHIGGSSPRMWGTLVLAEPHNFVSRFIPTHVGNTCSRACRSIAMHGSSPRMWGTRDLDQLPAVEHRFIPTHVGNTPLKSSAQRLDTVHPHACGEHLTDLAPDFRRCGSSPRMWGTHDRGRAGFRGERFIPTHVGNTIPASFNMVCHAVHPHACGEHADLDRPFSHVVRFIPTHVGNTLRVISLI